MKLPRISWFALNRTLHRDLGYLAAALMIVYAVSGVALNHVADWNPNYAIDKLTVDIGRFDAADLDAAERHVAAKLGLEAGEIRGRHRAAPDDFRVLLEEGSDVRVNPATGRGTFTRVKRRPLIFEVNMLHKNVLKGTFSLVADAAAILLLFLAVGGLFMIKGQRGFFGRGKWFFLAGLIVPIAYTALYYWRR